MSLRVLIVRFSAIGDCVMTAWAATAIRHRRPDAQIVWAVESRCAPVVDQKSLVNTCAEFPRDSWKANRWSPKTWREQLLAFTGLRRYGFDVGFDFQGHSKTALCLRIANPKRRFASRSTDALAKRLNPVVGTRPEGTHTVEWNHAVLCHAGDYDLPARPIMPPVDRQENRIATISVSAGQPSKAYSSEGWAHIGAKLLERGFRVAFLGGPTDRPIRLEGSEDYVGKLPLAETMRMVAQSAIHLAADTGTGHMAAAYGVPVVSIFGPMDPREFRPYTNHGVVLREGTNPSSVSPSAVLDAAWRLLEAKIPH